jgi:hypothetical protein
MTRDEVIRLIHEALATETSAVLLSKQLFSPEGLFRWLADTYEERKQLVASPLFQQALARFHQLQYQEAAEFGSSLRKAGFGGNSSSSEPAPSV